MSVSFDELPTISVIIPCFNGEARLPICLDSIIQQKYPKDKLEIVIIDDNSTDNTIKIAKEKYGCIVATNGTHNIERGKSIGVENSSGEYLFLIDDDNQLPNSDWLYNLVNAVVSEKATGGQASWFNYDRNDSLPNRYAALFGINDPTVFYLGRRDKLMQTEKAWTLPGTVMKETDKYFKVKFSVDNLLTVGSQGFLIKRDNIQLGTWQPYLYHMDINLELVARGQDTYIFMKDSVIHDHSKDIKHFISKLKRNISFFYSSTDDRKYKYDINTLKMITLGLIMGTFLRPIYDSIRGFVKIHDPAWFLHPLISFRVAVIYANSTLANRVFKRR